jgi:hypothetical protein
VLSRVVAVWTWFGHHHLVMAPRSLSNSIVCGKRELVRSRAVAGRRTEREFSFCIFDMYVGKIMWLVSGLLIKPYQTPPTGLKALLRVQK